MRSLMRKQIPANTEIDANEKIDAIGFVLSVLEQHGKEFDRLICKLSEITEQLRESDRVVCRIEAIDNKLENLRNEVSNMTKCRFGSK
jgi:hypothetical protein